MIGLMLELGIPTGTVPQGTVLPNASFVRFPQTAEGGTQSTVEPPT